MAHDDEEQEIPCTLMRAGTSKGVFLLTDDIPAPGPARDEMLKALMGSQDALQIDGLGGSRLVTAKLAIVGRSARDGFDVDFTYAIVPPERNIVIYTSNCGNISAGVGPFAIDNGLVESREGVTEVRIFNTNTGKLLVAQVLVRNGRAAVHGDYAIPGVPGTGAKILMDYRETVGAKTGRMFPTGSATDRITLADGRAITVTIGDVANPCVFVNAGDVGATACETPDAINTNAPLLATLLELRGRAAQLAGLCGDWHDAERVSPALPLVVMVAPAKDDDAKDLRARLVFYNKCHESMAGTGSMCLASMSRVAGTVVNGVTANIDSGVLRIGHPLGVMEVEVELQAGAVGADVQFERLGFGRTARRLMTGVAYVPRFRGP